MNQSSYKTLPQAYIMFWRNYLNFNGKSSRSEFWWTFLVNFLILVILSTLTLSLVNLFLYALWYGFLLAILIPRFALMARRLRDVGMAETWINTLIAVNILVIILSLIPGISGISSVITALFAVFIAVYTALPSGCLN